MLESLNYIFYVDQWWMFGPKTACAAANAGIAGNFRVAAPQGNHPHFAGSTQPTCNTAMTTARRNSNLPLATRSCEACKLRKRKCTRELPECRLCIRCVPVLYASSIRTSADPSTRSARRSCSYNSDNKQHSETDSSKQALKNDFPVAFFLDPVLSNCCAPLSTPRCQLPIPPQVEACLGDDDSKKALAAEYFKTAHRWMPIISRIRLYGSLINSLQHTDHGVTSILLAMKLALSCPPEANACSEIYVVLKEFQLRLEMAGYVSIYTLQSAILIAMYEMGHAIFPGAFTSISTCARHATTLSINEPLPVQGKAWIEQEERNRIWWAILILDR